MRLVIGMAVGLTGYTLSLYGWILLKGYNVSFGDLFMSPYWPPVAPDERTAGVTS